MTVICVSLKANHCCQSTDPSEYFVFHNTISEGRINVKEIIQHEEYSEDFLIQNDICIIITEPFVINETVQPACLGKILYRILENSHHSFYDIYQ